MITIRIARQITWVAVADHFRGNIRVKATHNERMKQRRTTSKLTLTGGAMVLAIASSVFAQEKPYTQPGLAQTVAPPPPPKIETGSGSASNAAPATAVETNAVEKFFNL